MAKSAGDLLKEIKDAGITKIQDVNIDASNLPAYILSDGGDPLTGLEQDTVDDIFSAVNDDSPKEKEVETAEAYLDTLSGLSVVDAVANGNADKMLRALFQLDSRADEHGIIKQKRI